MLGDRDRAPRKSGTLASVASVISFDRFVLYDKAKRPAPRPAKLKALRLLIDREGNRRRAPITLAKVKLPDQDRGQ
jgi:hypothetical protein